MHSQECKIPRRLTSDLDPKINGFPGLIVEHSYAKFGDHGCISFWDIVRKKRQTATLVANRAQDMTMMHQTGLYRAQHKYLCVLWLGLLDVSHGVSRHDVSFLEMSRDIFTQRTTLAWVGVQRLLWLYRVRLVFPTLRHLQSDAATITEFDIDIVQSESWKPVYFGIKR